MTGKIASRKTWFLIGALAAAWGGSPLPAQEAADSSHSPTAATVEQAAEGQTDRDRRKLADLEQYGQLSVADRLSALSLSQRACVHCHFKVPKIPEVKVVDPWHALVGRADAQCTKCHDAGAEYKAGATQDDCPALNPHCRRNAENKAMTTYLGVSTSAVPAVLRRHLKLPSDIGLLIEAVEADSPAEAAGVAQYDVLEKFDSQWLVNQEQFSVLVRLHRSGDEVALEIVRQGRPKTLSARLGEHEAAAEDQATQLSALYLLETAHRTAGQQPESAGEGQKASEPEATAAYLGVDASAPPAALAAQLQLPAGAGLLVDHVEPDSPAASAGIESGDILQKLDDQLLVNAEQLVVLVRNRQPGDEVQISVIRAGKPLVLQAVLGRRTDPKVAAAELIRSQTEAVAKELDAQLVDLELLSKLHDVVELRVGAPGELSDEVFLRRAYLDTTGTLPSAAETAAFQADARPDKRAKLIDGLLSRPETFAKFKDSAALKWSDVEHVLTLTAEAGGQKHLVVKDKSGDVVFEGPVDAAGDREKLPPDLAGKLLWMTRSLEQSEDDAILGASARRSLNQVVPKFAVQEAPLETTLKDLGEQTGAELVVNWKALKQAGVEPGEPITLELKGVRLSSVLKTILALAAGDGPRLGFSVEDEVIVISTTKAAAD